MTDQLKPGISYDRLKNQMRTFDLLLFRGTDFVSSVIARIARIKNGSQVRESANFTHVGIVFRGEDLMPAKNEEEEKWLRSDALYIFESTMSGDLADGCKDVNGEARFGVQMRVLDDVVEAYDRPAKSRLAWCHLVPDVDRSRARAQFEKYIGIRYDASFVNLGACAFRTLRPLRDSKKFSSVRDVICRFIYGKRRFKAGAQDGDNLVSNWQFCSELAANVYRDLGLLCESVNPSNAMPADFITNPKDVTKTLDADGEIAPLFDKPIKFHW